MSWYILERKWYLLTEGRPIFSGFYEYEDPKLHALLTAEKQLQKMPIGNVNVSEEILRLATQKREKEG